ncbi:hypothetical protein ACP26L_20030 [Paenibacillus sp. S-38]|uniref:hypothetical protein n=1 Tax=Paenibacillus sp. S-38 TaxID=3416710 RepID=UPI003CFABE6E
MRDTSQAKEVSTIHAFINILLVLWVFTGITASLLIRQFFGRKFGVPAILFVILIYGTASEWNGGDLNRALGKALQFLFK